MIALLLALQEIAVEPVEPLKLTDIAFDLRDLPEFTGAKIVVVGRRLSYRMEPLPELNLPPPTVCPELALEVSGGGKLGLIFVPSSEPGNPVGGRMQTGSASPSERRRATTCTPRTAR